jgi:TldD protein
MLDIEVINRVLELPARIVEVSAQRVSVNHLLLQDGVVREVSSGGIMGAGVRVLENGWGFASTTVLDQKGILDAGERAFKAAKNNPHRINVASLNPIKDNVRAKAKKDPEVISFDERRDILHEAEGIIKDIKEVASYSLFIADSISTHYFYSSEGAQIRSEYPRTAFSVSVFGKKNGQIQGASERLGGVGGFELVENFQKATLGACEKVLRLLDAGGAPRGRFRVVLDPRLSGVFIHEALGHAAEADHVLQGESILKDKLGKKIASGMVSIYDDPTLENSYGFYFYDAEGVKGRKKPIMEKGILKQFLSSRESAAAMGTKSTGNARSQGYDYPPLVRMSNTYIEPGDHTFEELIEDIKTGIYLKGSKGGEVDTARGIFQFNAEEGVLIEGGELTNTVRDVSLSGSTLDVLQKIDGVGNDFEVHIGYCGKEVQNVAVGDGGPHVRTMALVGGRNAWTRRKH